MTLDVIKVLLVEDNSGDERLIRELLSEESYPGFDVSSAGSLEEAVGYIQKNSVDAILLDLYLPDSQGLETFNRMQREAGTIPVVILTGYTDDATAIQTMRKGAQDCLIKGDTSPEQLVKAIRYAIERSHYMARMEEEITRLEKLTGSKETPVSTSLYGIGPLRESYPEIFKQLTAEYSRLLNMALEKRAYKTNTSYTSGERELIDKLGGLRAGPRDLIDIHVSVIKSEVSSMNSERAAAFIEEARLLVLELTGYLALFYRNNIYISGNNKTREFLKHFSNEIEEEINE